MTKPRVRFAPSPTGYLHIGGARTALFNWLWARKTGGTFILRIEDTDQDRNSRESVQAIFDAMRWLGLDWDEGPTHPDDEGGGPHGPYFQSKRLALYRQHADRLIAQGNAYRCYCTPAQLEAERNALPPERRSGFRHRCPERETAAEAPPRAGDGVLGIAPHVVRFRSPADGEIVFDDLVFGPIRTPNREQQDFILLRTDGMPLYNFGAVVDDVQMGITLVARGRDHIVNTPPQILLYNALAYPLPQFAHLPMMMASKSEKLSKRHGAVSVTDYRDKGWMAEGLLSYLVRFGWSHKDQELFRLTELVELFDWSDVNKADGIYDWRKCGAIQEKYVAQIAPKEEIERQVLPFVAARGLPVREGHPRLARAIATVRGRAKTGPFTQGSVVLPAGPLVSMADAMDFYFRAQPVMDPAAQASFLVPANAPLLDGLADAIEAMELFDEGGVKTAIDAWMARLGVDMKTVAGPARVALTGRSVSPGLYEIIEVLGREVSILRLRTASAGARGVTVSVPPAKPLP